LSTVVRPAAVFCPQSCGLLLPFVVVLLYRFANIQPSDTTVCIKSHNYTCLCQLNPSHLQPVPAFREPHLTCTLYQTMKIAFHVTSLQLLSIYSKKPSLHHLRCKSGTLARRGHAAGGAVG
jgi:hypothetical protein